MANIGKVGLNAKRLRAISFFMAKPPFKVDFFNFSPKGVLIQAFYFRSLKNAPSLNFAQTGRRRNLNFAYKVYPVLVCYLYSFTLAPYPFS
jgi:hypothetical protein